MSRRKYSNDKFFKKISHSAASGVVGDAEYDVKGENTVRAVSTFATSGTLTVQGRIEGSSTWDNLGTLASGGDSDTFDVSSYDFIRFNFTVAAGSTGEIAASGFFNGSSAGGGGASNSFTIIQPDAGTSPTADSATDTLTFTSSDGTVGIEGNSTTDTIDFTFAPIATASFADIENTYTAKISNNGTTASIVEQSGGFISSVTRTGTGFVTITFTTSFFSVAPVIEVTTTNDTGVQVYHADVDDETTTTNAYVYTRSATGTTGADIGFTIVAHRSGSDRNEPTIYYDSSIDIDGTTETITTDTANDYLLMYDASAGANRKVSPDNLGLSTPPAGSDGQIQFNDGGSFGADSNLHWDNTNKRLGIDNTAPNADTVIGNFTDATDRSFRIQRSGGIEFRANVNSSQVQLYGTRDMYISTNTTSRQIYIVPGGGATVEFDNNQTTHSRSIGYPIVETAVNDTLTTTDYTELVDCSSGARTITLPTAASASGRVYVIKKIDATGNAVTIDGDGSETIDGATTQTLSSQYDAMMIQSDGTEWWILSSS
jgi:hypothetical protein